MIPYENYQLNSRQIERISRMKARERIQQYIKEYGHAPSQEMISTFGAITADELEHYRRYYYSHNAEKENAGITATVEGWATQTQKTYDEFIRATYHLTDNQDNAFLNLIRILNVTGNNGPFSVLGYASLNEDELSEDYFNSNGNDYVVTDDSNRVYVWWGHRFNSGKIGTYTFTYLLKNPLSLKRHLFYNVNSLREITLPSCLSKIEQHCFASCNGLESIVCYAKTPPSLGKDVFNDVKKDGVLYVPSQSIPSYTEEWATLINNGWIIKPILGT